MDTGATKKDNLTDVVEELEKTDVSMQDSSSSDGEVISADGDIVTLDEENAENK